MNKRETGAIYEKIAANYLMDNGYTIITTNYRCKIGEIDIIAKDKEYLCFIEVKYRANSSTGYPSESITLRKVIKISKTAQHYMMINRIYPDTPCRFDVVTILDKDISLIKNAFDSF